MVGCQAPVCGSFEVVRLIGAPCTRVMQAYSDLPLRTRWFRIPRQRWASMVVISLEAGGHGTVLRHREQYALLRYSEDGSQDTAHLKGGTSLGLNGLAHALDAFIELPPAL